MKTKVMGALLLALIICASALVFASCARPGGEPAPSGGPDATVSGAPDEDTEATVTAEPDEDPEVYMDDSVREALEDYYALKQGDFSVLKKYWNGTLSEKITSEGAKLESAVYGLKTYCYAAPPIMTAERWDNMMAEAEEKYKDDPEFEFVRSKLEGFYVQLGLSMARQNGESEKTIRTVAGRVSLDLTKCDAVYICDAEISPPRMKELGRCFADYFGYTIEDVRDAAREVGIPDADLIGTVEPYFVFEYSDYGERVGAVEYSEEAVKKLESLCREYVDGDGNPLCYGKYEYKVTAVQEASYDEAFGEILSEYKELTGEDLHRICKITLEEKKIGETVAATGEYREFSPEEASDVGFEEIFLCISDGLEWEPEKIDFPWGGSARRALLLYAEVFDN